MRRNRRALARLRRRSLAAVGSSDGETLAEVVVDLRLGVGAGTRDSARAARTGSTSMCCSSASAASRTCLHALLPVVLDGLPDLPCMVGRVLDDLAR